MRELQAQKKQTRRSSTTAVAGNTGQSSKPHAARNGNGAPLPPPPPPSLTAPELAMLSAQARGPSPDDFFEILSKFKLAFNLLAKLKGCIHEPNAPELVHFLFTPLAIIIESARNGKSNISRYHCCLSCRMIFILNTKPASYTASRDNGLRSCRASGRASAWPSDQRQT